MAQSRVDVVADGIASFLLGEATAPVSFAWPVDEMFGRALDHSTRTRFDSKATTYKAAAIIRALALAERRFPFWAVVRERLQMALLSAGPPGSLHQSAAQSLDQLLAHRDPDSEEARIVPIWWARAWLDDIGINDVNYIHASLFSMDWMGEFVVAADFLRDRESTLPCELRG